jgi:predicted membrane protein (TIGR00267 family)
MRVRWRSIGRKLLLPVTMGLTDGILTALTLTASSLISNQPHITISIALRVAGVAFFSGVFVCFVTKYAEFRQELVHSERELSLLAHGKLALGYLGRSAIREAGIATLLSSSAAFLGALCPLVVATLFPRSPWTSVVTALIALALLGIALAKVLYGNMLRWAIALVIGGGLLTLFGIQLDII